MAVIVVAAVVVVEPTDDDECANLQLANLPNNLTEPGWPAKRLHAVVCRLPFGPQLIGTQSESNCILH